MSRGAWWRHAVGYEAYIRSFADADGDGVGDLEGIRTRLDHLTWLGVDLLWVTPFYPSPMRDHGYDVSDYTDVDPRFGTLADFDRLVAAAHERGIRLVIDLVPNHTSSDHPWFRQALADPAGAYRDYYIWRDPAPDGGPPNNWRSHFGGPAWTLDKASGQYWLHLFLPEQPDLNWDHEPVRAQFDRILRFWLERGADGFRIDVAHSLIKHPDLPDLPPSPTSRERSMGLGEFDALDHIYDLDQPGVVDIQRRWRRVAEPYDGVLIGETYVLDAVRLRRYLEPDLGLHLSFWFGPLHVPWTPQAIRRVLREGAHLPAGMVAWVTSSHDRPRAASRFGGGEVGRARALALAALQAGLPGVPFLYQGEELGLLDGDVPADRREDPLAVRSPAPDTAGRDVARTPMPWAPGPGLGFTTGEPWLPLGGRGAADTVAVQREDPDSWLHAYRRLLAARRALTATLPGTVEWLEEVAGPLLAYRRGDLLVAANTGDAPATLPLAGAWTVVFHRDPDRHGEPVAGGVALGGGEVVWLRDRAAAALAEAEPAV